MKILKKILICFVSTFLLTCIFALTGCKKDDTNVTVNGIKFQKVTFVNTDGISVQAYTVVGCDDNITILNIPEKINNLSVLDFKREAFLNNTNLKEIVIPDSITSISYFTAPFKGCTNIEKITTATTDVMNLFTDYGSSDNNKEHTIPASVKYIYLSRRCTEIGTRDFYYCSNIKEIHIPDTVEVIKDGTNLTSIGANGNPANSNKFSNLPFIGCTNLTIYCEAKTKPEGWDMYWNYINSTTYAEVIWNHY